VIGNFYYPFIDSIKHQLPDEFYIDAKTQMFFNLKAIRARIAAEPQLAAAAGIDPAKPIRSQLREIQSRATDDPSEQLYVGFVLGYPERAVRNYARSQELRQKGAVLADHFFIGGLDLLVDKLNIHDWDQSDFDKLLEMKTNYEKRKAQLQAEKVDDAVGKSLNEMREQYKTEIKAFYQKYQGLDSSDADFLLSQRQVQIRNNNDEEVYLFVDFGSEQEIKNDPSYQRVKKQVDTRYSELDKK